MTTKSKYYRLLLEVKFTHYTKVRSAHKPYISYELTVQSPSTNSWVLEKRYSEFHKLHRALRESGAKLGDVHLPGRRVFGSNLDDDFVKLRMAQLQVYMRAVLEIPGILQGAATGPPLMDFLGVPETVRPMLTGGGDARGGWGNSRRDSYSFNSILLRYPKLPFDERKVYQLIDQLRESSQRAAAIADYDAYFFPRINSRVLAKGARFRLPPDAIRHLLVGDGRDKAGLVQTCGNVMYSQVASRAALELLGKMVDSERNREAIRFLAALASVGPATLRTLNLKTHISSRRGSRLNAFRLLSTLRDQMGDRAAAAIVDDEATHGLFLQWLGKTTFKVAPGIDVAQPHTRRPGVIKLEGINPAEVVRAAAAVIINISREDSKQYHTVMPPLGAPRSRDEDMPKLEWKTAANGVVTARLRSVLDFSVQDIVTALCDPARARLRCAKFQRCRLVQRVAPNVDLVHFVVKVFTCPYKYRDFCVLRSVEDNPGGGKVIAMRSIDAPQVPPEKRIARALLFPSGHVVEPLGAGAPSAPVACIVTTVYQMNKNSVQVIAPDLLGESTEWVDSVARLSAMLTRDLAGGDAKSAVRHL